LKVLTFCRLINLREGKKMRAEGNHEKHEMGEQKMKRGEMTTGTQGTKKI
jgi:hypothetical protein